VACRSTFSVRAPQSATETQNLRRNVRGLQSCDRLDQSKSIPWIRPDPRIRSVRLIITDQRRCRFRVTSPIGDSDQRLVYVDISAPPLPPTTTPTTTVTSGFDVADLEVSPTDPGRRKQARKAARRRRLKKLRRRRKKLDRRRRRGSASASAISAVDEEQTARE